MAGGQNICIPSWPSCGKNTGGLKYLKVLGISFYVLLFRFEKY